MIIQFKTSSGEAVNTNFVTPQLMATVGPFTKLITYPTFDGPSQYTYTGPYYGANPNANAGTLGNTTPVEGQLEATTSGGVAVGPTGSVLFPLGQGGSYIGFYSPTGVLYTKFKMDDATAAAAGLTTIATALGAGDAILVLGSDGAAIP